MRRTWIALGTITAAPGSAGSAGVSVAPASSLFLVGELVGVIAAGEGGSSWAATA